MRALKRGLLQLSVVIPSPSMPFTMEDLKCRGETDFLEGLMSKVGGGEGLLEPTKPLSVQALASFFFSLWAWVGRKWGTMSNGVSSNRTVHGPRDQGNGR